MQAENVTGRVGDLRVMSWNVRGLNCHKKTRKVLQFAKSKRIDVLMLQETHLLPHHHASLAPSWSGPRAYASYSNYSRGVVILLRRGLGFHLHDTEADEQGRWALLRGEMEGVRLAFMVLYAPNFDSPDFVREVIERCVSFPDYYLCVAGDLNVTLNDDLDRSAGRSSAAAGMRAEWLVGMAACNMVDAWRVWHGEARQYTHYSSVHDLHTRLDYFLLTDNLFLHCEAPAIYPRTWSDHSPVSLVLHLSSAGGRRPPWRFKPRSVRDPVFCAEIRECILDYFELNKGTVDTVAVLWEAFKVVLRGACIAHEAGVLRSIRSVLSNLEARLDALTVQLEAGATAELRADYRTVLARYDEQAAQELLFLAAEGEARRYGEGQRPGRWLARAVTAGRTPSMVQRLVTDENTVHCSTPDILSDFASFYELLYEARQTIGPDGVAAYLRDVELAWVEGREREYLCAPITRTEILRAIQELSPGKAPGCDGLSIEFYREYSRQLVPYLLDLYTEAFTVGQLPPSLREAVVITLLKPDKPPDRCDSYRPLSLLNTDTKILSKVLANRLATSMSFLVRPDQAGFVMGRSTADNLRLLFALAGREDLPPAAVALALDFSKAFDSVDWGYLFTVLETLGLGSGFVQMVRVLCAHPVARVVVNGFASTLFPVARGTRQGCPLSPLLFALVVEPFACRLRQLHRGVGILLPTARLTISLYADDVLIYISDPADSLATVLMEVDRYSMVSGLTLNRSKSLLVPLRVDTPRPADLLTLTWAAEGFRYLGIWYSPDPSLLYRRNHRILLDTTASLVDRWLRLPLDQMARISLVKMVLLPKWLYLFLNVPILLSRSFFGTLRKQLLRLVWAGRVARVSYAALTLTMDRGGLGLPDLERYYVAAQLFFVARWYRDGESRPHKWAELHRPDGGDPRSRCLAPAPCRAGVVDVLRVPIALLLRVPGWWRDVVLYSPSMRIRYHPSLSLNGDQRWLRYVEKCGLDVLSDLFVDGWFVTANELNALCAMDGNERLSYWGARQACRAWLADFPFEPTPTPVFVLLSRSEGDAPTVSQICALLGEREGLPLASLRARWDALLSLPLSDDQWNRALAHVRAVSGNFNLRAMQFRILHMYYHTPVTLARFYPDRSPACPRCRAPRATFSHLIWDCPSVGALWVTVMQLLVDVVGVEIASTPECWLLGAFGDLRYRQLKLLSLGAALCKLVIVRKWMSKYPPTAAEWWMAVTRHSEQTRAYQELQGVDSTHVDILQPLLLFHVSHMTP